MPSGKRVCISETRFATKVFQLDGCFFNHARTTLESVQQCTGMFANGKDFLTNSINRVNITAANNSNRGIVIGLRGATFDRPVRRDTVTCPEFDVTRKNMTAAYAALDASANPCNSNPFVFESQPIQRFS